MKNIRIFGFILVFISILIFFADLKITGAFIGTNLLSYSGLAFLFILGLFLILLNGLEKRVVSSKVKDDSFLLRVADDIGKRESISRDINHLISELNKGNTNPGVGTKTIFTRVYELRGRNGGRVYYRQIRKNDDKNKIDKYEILGYSDKDSQERVINYLKKKYS